MPRLAVLLALLTLSACGTPHGGVNVGYAGGAIRVAPRVGVTGEAGTLTYSP